MSMAPSLGRSGARGAGNVPILFIFYLFVEVFGFCVLNLLILVLFSDIHSNPGDGQSIAGDLIQMFGA